MPESNKKIFTRKKMPESNRKNNLAKIIRMKHIKKIISRNANSKNVHRDFAKMELAKS
jgi:hypothetical protein